MMTRKDEATAKLSPGYGIALAGFLLVMVAAAVAYVIQYRDGLIRTAMANGFSWGLYVSTLAFFVGNAAGGLVLSSSIYIFGLSSLKPFARLGALTAFVSVVAAMLSILPDMGQPLRLWHILVYPQFSSPLVWDIIVLNVYAALTLLYLGILLLPDLPDSVKRFAAVLGDPERFSERWARRLAPVALFFAISIHVVTAWIFSTQGAREWWYTAALAPDFLAVAVMAGTTVVLLASVLLFGIRDEYGSAYRTMSKIIVAAYAVHVFLMYNDMFIKAWYNSEGGMHAIQLLLTQFRWVHVFEVVAPLAAILLLLGGPVWRSKLGVATACLLLLAGVVGHRYLIMPPAFNVQPLTFTPVGVQGILWSYPVASGRWAEGQDTFSSAWNYFPTAIEWLIFAGVCAFACFAIAIGAKVLPVQIAGNH